MLSPMTATTTHIGPLRKGTCRPLQVIVSSRLNNAISEVMSAQLFSVRADDPISLATRRLSKAKVTGLVVVEGHFPVGLLIQDEALVCKEVPRDAAVEQTMSPAMLCLETDTPIHRAAVSRRLDTRSPRTYRTTTFSER